MIIFIYLLPNIPFCWPFIDCCQPGKYVHMLQFLDVWPNWPELSLRCILHLTFYFASCLQSPVSLVNLLNVLQCLDL